jgi:NADPH:quinone reductase-like Zn-dependent oxidoreductase
MQAVVAHEYGQLRVEQIAKPELDDPDRVLVRVRAAAINPLDYHEISGTLVARPLLGWRRPKNWRRGVDAAGVVEAVGANVIDVAVGDEVVAWVRGALAEYARPPAKNTVRKPERLSFEQACTLPVAGVTALEAVRDRGGVQAGHHVLVYGASGGVGTFAVQIAKALGAHVTGVCSTRNVELVRSLGADEVVDYTRDDALAARGRYDVIVNCAGKRSTRALRRALKDGGTIVFAAGSIRQMLGGWLLKRLRSYRTVSFIADVTPERLQSLAELCADGRVTPVIDRTYPLADAREALDYLKQGHARGKVVLVP